ncbi:MAG: hypothetical protein QG635_1935 [Bacteroidota bacterium]|nr:hypothetical protein [Bacteroidota bacterium]
MKIKINWGIGIAIFVTLWVVFLAGNLIFSSFQTNDLVAEDYYQKELQYQGHIEKQKRTKKLSEQIKVVQGSAALALQFPITEQKLVDSGEIYMYRPSNKRMDNKIKVRVNDENVQVIDIRGYAKGLWILKINWSSGGNDYYIEESVNL